LLLRLEPFLHFHSILGLIFKVTARGWGQEKHEARKDCLREDSQSLVIGAHVMVSDYKSMSQILNTISLPRKRKSEFIAGN
jgi:hypothetical protein